MGDYLENVLRYCRSVNKNYEVHSTYHVLIVQKDFFLYSTIKSCMENTKFMRIYLQAIYDAVTVDQLKELSVGNHKSILSVILAAVTATSAQKLLKNIPVTLNPRSILYAVRKLEKKIKSNGRSCICYSVAFSPRANHTDRAAAASGRSQCQLFRIEGCHVVSATGPHGR